MSSNLSGNVASQTLLFAAGKRKPPIKKEIFDLTHFKYTRLGDGEKESIFWTYFDGSDDEKSGPAESREARDGTA